MKYLLALFIALLGSQSLAQIRVTDDREREIQLDEPAQRVVSLAPHITESLFAVGAGDDLVGAVNYSDYPEAAKDVPQVGSYNGISYETLVEMQPDLVLAWASGNGSEIIQRVESLGFPVYVTEPRNLEDIAQSLRNYGRLTGHAQEAEEIAADFDATLAELRRTYGDAEKVSIFYQMWDDPLMTLNDEHMISDVIRLCGGRNIFAEDSPMVLNISVESVLRRDPQTIIASGMGESRPQWLDDWKEWPKLQAVQNNHLYFVEPSLLQRHSTRILRGARKMCEALDKVRSSS